MSDGGVVLNSLALEWATAIWRACWQGGVAILLAWIVCRLLPWSSPRMQCWLWRLVYVRMLAALVWVAWVDLPLLPATPAAIPLLPAAAPLSRAHDAKVGQAQSAVSVSQAREEPALWPNGLAWLFCAWLVGSAWHVRLIARDRRNSLDLRARCKVVIDPVLALDCQDLCNRLGVRRPPRLLVMQDRGSPLVLGIPDPAILLPASLPDDYTPAERRLILAHELAHLKRLDLLWAWLPNVARCLFFFHPLVWLAEREWEQAQEIACDEEVIRLAEAPRSVYGDVLLKIVSRPQAGDPSGIAALRVAESYSTVRRRLLAMKKTGLVSRRSLVAAGVLVATFGLVGLVPWRVAARVQNIPDLSTRKVTLSIENANLRDALNALFSQVRGTYRMEEAAQRISATVTVSMTDVSFPTALASILRSAASDFPLAYRVERGVYVIYRAAPQPPSPTETRVTLNLKNVEIDRALKMLFDQAGVKYRLAPVTGTVSAALDNMPLPEALSQILHSARTQVPLTYWIEDGAYLVLPMTDPHIRARISTQKVTLRVKNKDLRYALKDLFRQVSSRPDRPDPKFMGANYTTDPDVEGTATVDLEGVPFPTALERLLSFGRVPLWWRLENGVYVVFAAPPRKDP